MLKVHHLENFNSVLSCPYCIFPSSLYFCLAKKINKITEQVEGMDEVQRAIARFFKRINSRSLVQIRSTSQDFLDYMINEKSKYVKHQVMIRRH